MMCTLEMMGGRSGGINTHTRALEIGMPSFVDIDARVVDTHRSILVRIVGGSGACNVGGGHDRAVDIHARGDRVSMMAHVGLERVLADGGLGRWKRVLGLVVDVPMDDFGVVFGGLDG